ncbi:hypothetical protein VTL71DRAFT_7014 [Oculimacula yallundae]|uniref:Uncharacterized protein n=1 Tax=Oculimacula yallundae TaxID=86028 RepID=A0ABR4BWC2_9HELO
MEVDELHYRLGRLVGCVCSVALHGRLLLLVRDILMNASYVGEELVFGDELLLLIFFWFFRVGPDSGSTHPALLAWWWLLLAFAFFHH